MPELFVPGVVIAQDGFFGHWRRGCEPPMAVQARSSVTIDGGRDTLVKLSSTTQNICA